jgi:uncharacterized membrane protein YkvA (DUF1232 family)
MPKKPTEKKIKEVLEKGASKVNAEDVALVLKRRKQIENKFSGKGPLGKFVADGKLLWSLIKDYSNRRYRKVPWWSIAAAVFALLYVLNPFDLVPDFLPFLGQIDDAMVMAACLAAIDSDLMEYRDWKIHNV